MSKQPIYKPGKASKYQAMRLQLLGQESVKFVLLGGYFKDVPAVHLMAILEDESGQAAKAILIPIAKMYDLDDMKHIGDPFNNKPGEEDNAVDSST